MLAVRAAAAAVVVVAAAAAAAESGGERVGGRPRQPAVPQPHARWVPFPCQGRQVRAANWAPARGKKVACLPPNTGIRGYRSAFRW